MSNKPKIAILHYAAPPVVGGVESVIFSHAQILSQHGYLVRIIAGRGEQSAMPDGTELISIPEIDSQHPAILALNQDLEKGQVPPGWEEMVSQLVDKLRPLLAEFQVVLVHNVLTKHFNLPLTAALFRLVDEGAPWKCIGWCHDFSWTSENSRSKVFPGYPWDLLRTYHPAITYVTVSEYQRLELVNLLGCPPECVRVVYNGVDPVVIYGLSPEGQYLVDKLELLTADLILLMAVRVTTAKNMELAAQVTAALKQSGSTPRLVITGPPDPHSEANMQYYHGLMDLRRALDIENEMRFVYESGPQPDEGYIISQRVVGDLMRVSDLLFMPSFREGFGMPIVEAGLLGIPVVCSENVPAALEIAGESIYQITPDMKPDKIATLITDTVLQQPSQRLRREVRCGLTWEGIYRRDIEPLLIER